VTEGDDLFYQDLTMIEGLSEAGDRFGGAMTSGDFDRDGRADLVVAAPTDDVGAVINGGLINVIMGTEDGLGAADGQLLQPNQRCLQAVAVVAQLRSPRGNLLPQGKRHRIHQMRSPGFDRVAMFVAARLQRGFEPLHRRQ